VTVSGDQLADGYSGGSQHHRANRWQITAGEGGVGATPSRILTPFLRVLPDSQ
jgi:hypothetical protein